MRFHVIQKVVVNAKNQEDRWFVKSLQNKELVAGQRTAKQDARNTNSNQEEVQ